jgi:acetyl-CoA synthetase
VGWSISKKNPKVEFMNQIKSFIQYEREYKKSVDNPEKFWGEIAKSFKWKKVWKKVLKYDWSKGKTEWFVGGKLNITENCLDRYVKTQPNKIAIIWEPNSPDEKGQKITYKELYEKVCAFANVLKNNGIKKGDRVCVYMGMTPEIAIAMLACARIGAVHSVVFGGFSAVSLAGRIKDANCKLLITSDGAYRGNKKVELKKIADEALEILKASPEGAGWRGKTIVLKRTNQEIEMKKGRDLWWHEEISKLKGSQKKSCKAEVMDAEDKLFILYTSGSTGKPKGIVHTTAGYMVYTAYTFLNVFGYKKSDVYWCTADAGWITGHSYMLYGPLLNGATTVMFEGIPTYPDAGRSWEIVDKYKVNIFYTSPTAIRSLQAQDIKYVKKYSLKSLRVLGTVGEPINEEAWHWYNKYIGKNKCPIVDTWWQTETGGFMLSPIAGVTKLIPSHATLPLPGVQPVLLNEKGDEIKEKESEGILAFRFPWPGISRTINNDHQKFFDTYFKTFPGYYFPSDGAKRDKNGNYRITGRVDDCINVSGHLLGTAEIENAINKHEKIVESAVVGFSHPIKGTGIYAFVISSHPAYGTPELLHTEIGKTVAKFLGPIAKPDKVQIVSGLPKTRSGKIMRRILRKIVEGDLENLGDISTLLDPAVVEEIVKGKI